ncbi:hypothetical protein KR222_003247 [Zaprionus bogoriensis]|nr:hypothetical protein KR222_003247 [Zaprionus bogoriensis]
MLEDLRTKITMGIGQRQQIGMLLMALLLVGGGGGRARAEEEEEISMGLSEVVEMIDPFGQNCEPKPRRSDIEDMVLNKQDPPRESKCFRRCLLRQFEVMPEGQMTYDEGKLVDMMNMMFHDKEAESRKIAKKCNGKGHATDECESAHSIAMCILKDMREASYKIPEVKQ